MRFSCARLSRFAAAAALCGFFQIAITDLAHAVAMRHDFYDPSLADGSKEIRYRNLAAQPRFQAVGSLNLGFGAGATSGCTGTLINASTVLTAAHCFDNPLGNHLVSKDALPNWSFTFGSDAHNPTQVLRVRDFKKHEGYNLTGAFENDLMLLQVYDAIALGPVSNVQPAFLYRDPDELSNPNFAVMTGYGYAAYGADVPGGPEGGFPVGGTGTKRGALNEITDTFGRGGADNMLYIQFDSPGNLVNSGLPANFLEGSGANGDSGGGLFLPSNSVPGAWDIVGVLSYGQNCIGAPNGAVDANPRCLSGHYEDLSSEYNDGVLRYRQYPLEGGAKSAFTRVSSYADWIDNNTFGPATPFQITSPPGPGMAQMTAASPVSMSTTVPLLAGIDDFQFDVMFSEAVGSLSVFLGGNEVLAIQGSAFTPSVFDTVTVLLENALGSDGLFGIFAGLEFLYDGPAGSSVFLDNISFPGIVNGDFSKGLIGWTASNPDNVVFTPTQGGGDGDGDGDGNGDSGGDGGATPIPEPNGIMLLAFGALALLGLAASRRQGCVSRQSS